MAAILKVNDVGGIVRTIQQVTARDMSGTVRDIQAIHVRDVDNVSRLVFQKPGAFHALHYLWLVVRGLHLRRPDVEHRRVSRLTIAAPETIPATRRS